MVTQSCPTLGNPEEPVMLLSPRKSPGKNTRVGSCSLLQGISPAQGLSPGLPHCRQILHQLSHQGSPRTLEWVAYPFSGDSSWPRNQTRVSRIAGRFFTSWATRDSLSSLETLFTETGSGMDFACRSSLQNPESEECQATQTKLSGSAGR